MKTGEKEIIEGLKRGEESAYRYIFSTYYSLMCHLAQSLLHDEQTAQALASDVISHLFEVKDTLDIHSSLRSFLMTSVRNTCINHMGTRLNRTEVAFSALGSTTMVSINGGPSYSSPLESLLGQEMESKIEDAIHSLPETTQRVFCKSRFDGKNYKEIAQEEGVSINAIKYHMKRSLKSLHEKLGGQYRRRENNNNTQD